LEESSVNFKTNFPEAHDGRRVKKSNGRNYWFSSVTGDLLVETDGSGAVLSQYIYFGGRRVARKDGSGNVYYYFEEPVGRTRTITGATGVACNEADYYLFGGEQSHGNTCDQNYHFAGMYRDGETGNDYTQFRIYESNLGRWMTPDPVAGDISNPQSLNRYAYALNNPTSLTDPLGLKPDDSNSVDVDSIIDSFFGGSFFGGGCFADGAPTLCFMVNAAVAAGAAVQCPNNICKGWETDSEGNSRFVQFMAFADDTAGYYAPGQAPQQNSLALELQWMEGLVHDNNSSGLSDSVAVCTSWKESGFNLLAHNTGGGGFGAIGLFQVRRIGLKDFNQTWLGKGSTPYTQGDLWDPTLNTYIGTAELYNDIGYAGGTTAGGLDWYHWGTKNPPNSDYSASILTCSQNLFSQGTGALK
jgi:RHS repeat-associated protein